MTSENINKSQWDCIRENIGVWNGAFLQFSMDGELQKDTPSVLTLAETEPDKTMSLTLERMPDGEPKKFNNLTFTYPGPAPYTYFFESGAFSQGSSQWSSFGQFLAEFSMKVGDRRIRFVVAYESTPSYTSTIKYVTLICETQSGGTQFKADPISAEQLLGTWQGSGESLDVCTRSFEKKNRSRCQFGFVSNHQQQLALQCEEQIGEHVYSLTLKGESTGNGVERSDEKLSRQRVVLLKDAATNISYQLMLLPNRTYCLLPREICRECDFRLEVGWLSEENERSRFVRYYDTRGVWMHSAQLSDAKC